MAPNPRVEAVLGRGVVDQIDAGGGTVLVIPRTFGIVADSVEASLAERPARHPAIDCYRRAAVSHIVLSVVTGREWYLNAGRFFADTGARDCDVERLGWSPEDGRREGGLGGVELHAWATCPLDPLPSTGLHDVRADRLVIFDPSSRHLPENARAIGGHWSRPVLPVAYGTRRDLFAAGYEYEVDVEATERVWSVVTAALPMIEAISRRALDLVNSVGDRGRRLKNLT